MAPATPLDSGHQVHGVTHDGEVQATGGADVAVDDVSEVNRDSGVKRQFAVLNPDSDNTARFWSATCAARTADCATAGASRSSSSRKTTSMASPMNFEDLPPSAHTASAMQSK